MSLSTSVSETSGSFESTTSFIPKKGILKIKKQTFLVYLWVGAFVFNVSHAESWRRDFGSSAITSVRISIRMVKKGLSDHWPPNVM